MALARDDLRETVSGYAALLRVPNLFTAPPDVALGVALAAAAGAVGGSATASPVVVALVMVASMLFYAGGTALNDYADADEDAVERPERPIPSGRVPRRAALAVGVGALAGGVALVAIAAPRAVAVAVALALGIMLYDGLLKGGPAGFVTMGVVRGLDVSLGLAAVAGIGRLPTWALLGPVIVAGYVATVTYMAEHEAVGGRRGPVAVAVVGAALAALGVPLVHVQATAGPIRFTVGLLLAGGFVVWTGRSLRRAYAEPVPDTVGPAVGVCVLALVVLDAALAAAGGLGWAAAALAFLAPAVGLARVFDVS